jgi:2-desacetyl-2-hydroxyethyl bacteriochlorophyllide A dehydrogenase
LVETVYSCISPGTELRCLAGRQINSPLTPYIPGYSLSGRVLATGAGVTLPPGTPVYCNGTIQANCATMWGGHTGLALQRASGVYPLPAGVDLLDASMIHLIGIAYHGLCLSRPLPHEVVAVVGLGPIGLLSARLHALSGARVIAADLATERVALAQQSGIEAFVPQGSLKEAFAQVLPGGADVVVDATGAPALLPQTLELAKDKPFDDSLTAGARFLIQGSYADEIVAPYHTVFMKEISLWTPRDTQPRDVRAAIDLLARRKLAVHDLLTVFTPAQAPDVYAELQQGKGGLMTAAFDWK